MAVYSVDAFNLRRPRGWNTVSEDGKGNKQVPLMSDQTPHSMSFAADSAFSSPAEFVGKKKTPSQERPASSMKTTIVQVAR